MRTDFKSAFFALRTAQDAMVDIHFIGRSAHIMSFASQGASENEFINYNGDTVPIAALLEKTLSLLGGIIDDHNHISAPFGSSSKDDYEEAFKQHLRLLRTRYQHISIIKSCFLRRTTKDDQVFFRLLLAGNRNMPPFFFLPPVTEGTLLSMFVDQELGNITAIDAAQALETSEYWVEYAAWCQKIVKLPNPYSPCYKCETCVDVCYAIFDYMVDQQLNLRECKRCGRLFIPEYQPKERYCSEECRNASISERVAIKRTDPLYREIESIKQLLKRRMLSTDPSRRNDAAEKLSSFEADLCHRKLELADGVITKDEMENFLTSYHTELKRTYQHKPRQRKST